MAMNFKYLSWKRRKGCDANTKFAEFGTKQFKREETDTVISYWSKPLRCSEEVEWTFETEVRLKKINGK